MLTSAYLWLRAQKHWVIDYTRFNILLGHLCRQPCIPHLSCSYTDSPTISVQESDNVQATIAGPSLYSSLSGHSANMEDCYSDARTVPTDFPKVDNKSHSGATFPADEYVLSTKSKFYAYMMLNSHMPSFLQSSCKMFSELINQHKASVLETIRGTQN